MFQHADGRWIEAILLGGFDHLSVYNNPGGGLYIGADPSCDIVLDDDGVEDFHGRYTSQGHHQYLEVIAGVAHGHRVIAAGERDRSSWKIAGWGLSELRADMPNIAAIRTALSIAADASAEGRHDAAVAILAQVGYRRIEVVRRTAPPPRLAESELTLRVRVESADGSSEVRTIGSPDRLGEGITLGSTPDYNVVIPTANANRVRIQTSGDPTARRRAGIDFFIEAGAIAVLPYRTQVDAPRSYQPYYRWERFGLGDAVVQLCRWPRRDETR